MLNFKLFGFPVSVHWMFWVVCAMLGGGLDAKQPEDFQHTLLFVAAAFISVLFHELGHAIFMRKYGGWPSIRLYGLGGLASGSVRLTRRQDIIMSAAGPAFGLLLYLVTRGIFGLTMQTFISRADSFETMPALLRLWLSFLLSMLFVNLWWSILNLLPIIPLDGGRIMAAVLSPKVTLALKISLVSSVVVGVYFLIHGQTYNAVLFGFLAVQSFQRLQSNPAPYWPGMR